ncbi:MAG TPA: peptide deformylase [Thermoanaerobaculia bacterium]|nr:peptide deformylase [Thermoanaerobaculia bacterium]
MIRDIVKFGDPRLLAPNAEVGEFDGRLAELVADLVETCHAAPGLGLAAPQVGVNLRVAIVDLSVGQDPAAVTVLVNPRIVREEGEIRSDEGCLSIPGLSEPLARPATVVVEAADAAGRRRAIEATGLFARALCHETDHLDQKLFVHRLRGLKKELVLRKVARRYGTR